jgi:hypothetical protein
MPWLHGLLVGATMARTDRPRHSPSAFDRNDIMAGNPATGDGDQDLFNGPVKVPVIIRISPSRGALPGWPAADWRPGWVNWRNPTSHAIKFMRF